MPRGIPKKKVAKKKVAKKKVSSKADNGVPKKKTRKKSASAVEEEMFPLDYAEKLAPIEGLHFAAMDAELRNHLQGIKIADLEIEKEQRRAQESISGKENHKNQLKAAYDAKKVEYDALVKKIASDRGFDFRKMSIDPDTFVVRDLRE